MKKQSLASKLKPYIIIAPCMFLVVLFIIYPVVNMFYLSFFEYDLITEKKFIGFDNYYRLLFVNVDFWSAAKNTVIYTFFVLLFLLFFALMFALWFQKSTRLNALAQRIMYFPNICSMVAVSMIFSWLMDEKGLFNTVLNFFNLPGLRWLESSSTVLMSIIIVAVWKSMGYNALLLMSALKSIPAEINEAAELDDAKPITKFFKITLPMLSPQLFFMLINITTGSFKVFETVRLLTGGGPGNSSDVLVFYIYRYAMSYLQFGYASAGGVCLFLFLAVLTVLYFKVIEPRVHYQ